jgi:hypothetical protein
LIASFVDILSAEFIGTPLLFIYSLIRKHQLAPKAGKARLEMRDNRQPAAERRGIKPTEIKTKSFL